MARRVSTQRIKMHRTYEIGEASDLLGVTPQTVRAWGRRGLRMMTDSRPFLILGADLKAYLDQVGRDARQPLPFGTFYCMTCKAPQHPALGLADYRALSDAHGVLAAFCAACEGRCSRIIRRADVPAWRDVCLIGGSIADSA